MGIDKISPELISGELKSLVGGTEKTGATSFKKYLTDSVNTVNSLLNESDKKSLELATGKAENLHSAMIAFEKAESAFKLLMQVRNRAIEAYQEVLRMQV